MPTITTTIRAKRGEWLPHTIFPLMLLNWEQKKQQNLSLILQTERIIHTTSNLYNMKQIILSILLCSTLPLCSQNIQLPTPNKTGGKPLMNALNERCSTREFSTKELSLQQLSNLLWAAWGYNRNDKRTAPSSMNKQELDLYAVTRNDIYLYDAKKNILIEKVKGDFRSETGEQPFVGTAPLNVVYVANLNKMTPASDTSKMTTANINCGFVAQNIYLYCTSEGLGTVVRGYVNREKLAKTMQLSSNQTIIVSQTVGFPK